MIMPFSSSSPHSPNTPNQTTFNQTSTNNNSLHYKIDISANSTFEQRCIKYLIHRRAEIDEDFGTDIVRQILQRFEHEEKNKNSMLVAKYGQDQQQIWDCFRKEVVDECICICSTPSPPLYSPVDPNSRSFQFPNENSGIQPAPIENQIIQNQNIQIHNINPNTPKNSHNYTRNNPNSQIPLYFTQNPQNQHPPHNIVQNDQTTRSMSMSTPSASALYPTNRPLNYRTQVSSPPEINRQNTQTSVASPYPTQGSYHWPMPVIQNSAAQTGGNTDRDVKMLKKKKNVNVEKIELVMSQKLFYKSL